MKLISISIRMMVVMTLLTGIVYPLAMTFLSQTLFPKQARGSLIENSEGQVIGSELIAQKFTLEKYFWSRPSAVNYDSMSSGGSNWSSTSEGLLKAVEERRRQGLTDDLLFSSASGLDPHISLEGASSQIERVLTARRGTRADRNTIERLIFDSTEGRAFGFLGQPRVNVLKLNLSLDREFLK